MTLSLAERLEAYSDSHPQEVLLVDVLIDGECDRVLIFRGYSSSLMGATTADLGVPVIPSDAVIETISRLQAPYQPDAPLYLERDLDWPAFDARLAGLGI
ncbi:MAG: hypothetical protein AAFY57_04375 [Cyanobacteria bacterium J06642_2]